MLDRLQEKGTRLVQLRAKLAARTNSEGVPHMGYEKNVELLRAEIDRMEKLDLTTSSDNSDPPAVALETSEHQTVSE